MERDLLYYYINKDGQRANDGAYEWALPFWNGLACVKNLTGRLGLIDRRGDVIVALPKYQEDPTNVYNDRILVNKTRLPGGRGNTFGFLSVHGEEIIPPQYLFAHSFSEGVASVQSFQERKYGFIDVRGIRVNEVAFEELQSIREGLAVAKKAGEYFYVDNRMEIALGPFEKAHDFHEGIACVVGDGVQQFIDKSGKLIFKNRHDWVSGICIEGRMTFIEDEQSGFLDKEGNVVIQPMYREADSFSEGAAIVQSATGKKIAIDQEGKILFEADYDWIGQFNDGLARFRQNEKYGYVDKLGRVVIDCKFKWADDFAEGLAPVSEISK